MLASANLYYFGLDLLGLTPRQLNAIGFLLALSFVVYWRGRVERR
jgi:hypothetical protein